MSESPGWIKNLDEEVVVIVDQSATLERIRDSTGASLFDSLYNSDADASDSADSFAGYSLCDISETYGFSLSYLGDYVVELGCQPPIDIDARLSSLLTGAQIYSLMEAVNTLDPYESNAEYDSYSLADLSEELDISMERALKVCKQEGFNLPFGPDSLLHVSIVERFRKIYTYDEFQEEEDLFGAIDVDPITGEAIAENDGIELDID